MSITAEAVVRDFCLEYHTWATDGAPDGKPFYRSFSLCENLRHLLTLHQFPEDLAASADAWLLQALPASPWRDSFPFNNGIHDWLAEGYQEAHHLNEKRIAWCKEYGNV